jgi:hypothetical protein
MAPSFLSEITAVTPFPKEGIHGSLPFILTEMDNAKALRAAMKILFKYAQIREGKNGNQ